LSGARDLRAVNEQAFIDAKKLIREVLRYLAAVDAFRAAGCEPTWRPEPTVTSAGTRAPRARDARPAPA
jgi:hypothetical protein